MYLMPSCPNPASTIFPDLELQIELLKFQEEYIAHLFGQSFVFLLVSVAK